MALLGCKGSKFGDHASHQGRGVSEAKARVPLWPLVELVPRTILLSVVSLLALVLLGCSADALGPISEKAARASASLAAGALDGLGTQDWPAEPVVAGEYLYVDSLVEVDGDCLVVYAREVAEPEALIRADAVITGDVRADSIQVEAAATVDGNVSFNELDELGVVTGTRTSPLAIPLTVNTRVVPAVNPGVAPVDVGLGTGVTLAPGAYGDVTLANASAVEEAASLLLEGGTYHFSSFTAGDWAKVQCLAPCELRVQQWLRIGDHASLGPASDVNVRDVELFVLGTEHPAVRVGSWGTMAAWVMAPNGPIQFAGASRAAGKLVGSWVWLKWDMRFAPAAGPCVELDTTFDGLDDDCDGVADDDLQENVPPVIVSQPSDLTVSMGEAFSLSVEATGTNLEYQWQRYGADIDGAVEATYLEHEARYEDDGATYRVVVSNPLDTVVSETVSLTVVDNTPPTLELNNAPTKETTEGSVVVSGTATDLGAGVASVVVLSDRFVGQSFGASLGVGGTFNVEVPLATGENQLTVLVTDGAENENAATITVTAVLPRLPRVEILSPVTGTTTLVSRVDVSGTVQSSLSPTEIQVKLGDIVTVLDGSDGEYTFLFEGVHLLPGANPIEVRAETVHGTSSAETVVTLIEQSGSPDPEPPEITVYGVQEDLYVTADQLIVSGTVTAQVCVQTITVNGEAASITGAGSTVSYEREVLLSAGAQEVEVTVAALACNGEEAQVSFTVHHDSEVPLIDVDVLQPAPAVNSVSSSPYGITGRVTEPNLAGFTANNQTVTVLPASGDVWDFAFEVNLVHGQPTSLLFEAWDRSGNRASHETVLQLDAALDLTILSPEYGAELLSLGGTIDVQVTARAPGIGPTDVATVTVGSQAPVPLTIAGSQVSGTVTLPGAQGTHQLVVEVHSSGGDALAQSAVEIHVMPYDDVPLQVIAHEPANGAENLEPEQAITLLFNKPFDRDELAVSLAQTVHSKQLQPMPAGADFTMFGNAKLVETHLDNASVSGRLDYLPGDRLVVFYPDGQLAWNSSVRVEVAYEGAEVWRGAFTVRPFPTLLQGFVVDQFGAALPRVPVELVDLGVSSQTDSAGFFTFGFGGYEDAIVPGRHRLRVNGGQTAHTHGTLDFWVQSEAEHLTSTGVMMVPRLDPSRGGAYIVSGTSEVALLEGAVLLDLSEAEIQFPNGHYDGDVFAQRLDYGQFSYPIVPIAVPSWVYAVQPGGVRVEGAIGLEVALSSDPETPDFVGSLPDRLLVLGVDEDALALAPMGVAQVDRENERLVATRLELQCLDYLGFAIGAPEWQDDYERYERGEMGLGEFVGRLGAQ